MDIEEFCFDLNEKTIENFKKAINYGEIKARHKRFMNGNETIDDLINGILHYRIKNNKDLDLDVVEFKYYQKIIDLYKTRLKELELKEKVIDEMAFELMRLSTVESVLAKDLKKRYCDFANDEEADCCWKTDKNCSDCMKEYFTNKVRQTSDKNATESEG